MPSADNAFNVNKFLHEPIAVSFECCRFQLPVDMAALNTIGIEDYLRSYCVVQSRRRALYDYFFRRRDVDRDGFLTAQETRQAIEDIYNLPHAIECFQKVVRLLKLDIGIDELEEHKEEYRKKSVSTERKSSVSSIVDRQKSVTKERGRFDFDLFKGIAALVERILYNDQMTPESGKNIHTTLTSSAATSSSTIERQCRLEKTDFNGLGTKLQGVMISDELRTPFKWLTG